ncbi:MAG: hypothetical protein IKC41_01760 [Clostridia bacterium]|nr:hypothetical protein [Clostridia bacterium]MBR2972917.1 hypothetical protein [Clostridia bacterium]MBR3576937.1 hypothetical protein [Clostridia bacterium]
MIKHGKEADIVKKAQNIIDNYVLSQTKEVCTKISKTDIFLWSAAAAASVMTLTLYILTR